MWKKVNTLGEGGFATVYLAVHKVTSEARAFKVIKTSPESTRMIQNELCINSLLDHPNVVKYYGHEENNGKEVLMLEYCGKGELWNWIGDNGISEQQAQIYFQQLITGVEYLHSMDIVHRDIKPSNLLLDSFDRLKISDFGLSAIFVNKGEELWLGRVCGTGPYMAPEVFSGRTYKAPPVDIWSCGVVLAAMMIGGEPWEKAKNGYYQYRKFKNSRDRGSSWKSLPSQLLDLLYKMLEENPKTRISIPEIKRHPWFLGKMTKGLKRRQSEESGETSGQAEAVRSKQPHCDPRPEGSPAISIAKDL
ncbi:PREDICTED: serine/threonine-protein kinase Chk1-like [Nanorana parkeri]|uniref:serine/threonine-protein kinase Chk1-like n=1 Tax=Nanorana parkeri TaxID=125878 RepID=UPI00085467D8|nr:PREDICTED: serine/threonine-protein kinase Chk1-like [Nanorana parkeri]